LEHTAVFLEAAQEINVSEALSMLPMCHYDKMILEEPEVNVGSYPQN